MGKRKTGRRVLIVLAVLVVLMGAAAYALLSGQSGKPGTAKPIILYVNQGNGVVNGSGFVAMLHYASVRGFNTVFFQVYRQGSLMFSAETLSDFVVEAHHDNMSIFFSLYITNSTQQLPESILNLGEDGVNLDMSNLGQGSQQSYLTALKSGTSGKTSVTELWQAYPIPFTTKPDLLVLETYTNQSKGSIAPGIIGSVEARATASYDDYQAQFKYALQHSDGVMVFDYAGMKYEGY